MEAVSLNKFIEIMKNGTFSDDSEYKISLGSYSLERVFTSPLLSRGKRIGVVAIVWNQKKQFHLGWETKLYEAKPDGKYLDRLASLISEKTGWRQIE
jgi:hypothetical protein